MLEHRNCIEVEGVPGGRFKSADSALAEYHLVVALAEDIFRGKQEFLYGCLLYTSDAADDLPCVDLGRRRIIKKKNQHTY